jgi:hypothetical protein
MTIAHKVKRRATIIRDELHHQAPLFAATPSHIAESIEAGEKQCRPHRAYAS